MQNHSLKPYNLEKRTESFAKRVRNFIKLLPKSFINYEDCKQLLRSSGSVAANFIEANECLSKKDFIYRIRICKKESKESCLWLRLMLVNDSEFLLERDTLQAESHELELIFGSIIRNRAE